MNLSTASIYASRDNATAALRKLGITKADYDDFIVVKDGKFYADLDGARKFGAKPAAKEDLKSEEAAAAELKPVTKPVTKKTVAKTTASTKAKSLSATIRDLITAGKTNDQIWSKLSAAGLLSDRQKHYPGWYRNEMQRAGKI